MTQLVFQWILFVLTVAGFLINMDQNYTGIPEKKPKGGKGMLALIGVSSVTWAVLYFSGAFSRIFP